MVQALINAYMNAYMNGMVQALKDTDIQCTKPPKQDDQPVNAHTTSVEDPPTQGEGSGLSYLDDVPYVCRRAMTESCLASGGVRLRRQGTVKRVGWRRRWSGVRGGGVGGGTRLGGKGGGS